MDLHLNLEVILVGLTFLSGLIILLYALRGKSSKDKNGNEPILLDYSKSFFPILLIVIVMRSFVAEPFRIPSGSMIPTLEIGDFVLVKKYAYGIKLPVIHKKIFDVASPERGDVVVFRYPPDPRINYIKRLIGLPGDEIEWTKDKTLIVNSKKIIYKDLGKYQTSNRPQNFLTVTMLEEKGNYFMMGDNRDNSKDSRSWEYVPEANLVGKASLVWMHWDWLEGGDGFNPSRIGMSIK